MIFSKLKTAVAFMSFVAASNAGQLMLNDSLGTEYPFVVHLPDGAGQNMKNPPLHVFLPGMGSRGSASEAVEVSQWNGIGNLLREYNAGNHSDAPTLAAESWVIVIPVAPNDTVAVPEYDIDVVKTIVDDVQAQYNTDPNKVTLSGYSMGARAIWKFLVKYDSIVAAAGISAGEPNVTTTNFQAFANTPVRHYVGSNDYDGSSSLAVGNQTQDAINKSGSSKTELIVIDGPPVGPNGQAPHNQMSSAPFTSDMLTWLLDQSLSNNTGTSPSSSPSATSSTAVSNDKDGSGSMNLVATVSFCFVILVSSLGLIYF